MARDVAGEGVLAVRDNDGRIRAFYNVCRHRGNVLCDERQEHEGRVRLPYHNWTYDLEGNLVGTPPQDALLHRFAERYLDARGRMREPQR